MQIKECERLQSELSASERRLFDKDDEIMKIGDELNQEREETYRLKESISEYE